MPIQTAMVVFTRSITAALRNLVQVPPVVRHRVAMKRGGDELFLGGLGNRSPASCSMENWSNGLFSLNARIRNPGRPRSSAADRRRNRPSPRSAPDRATSGPNAAIRGDASRRHETLICVRGSVVHERIHFLDRWRQPGQIERHATDERRPISFRLRFQSFLSSRARMNASIARGGLGRPKRTGFS